MSVRRRIRPSAIALGTAVAGILAALALADPHVRSAEAWPTRVGMWVALVVATVALSTVFLY